MPVRTVDDRIAGNPPALDFALPVDQEFDSRPPFIDPQAMVRRCEEMMPFRNARAGEQERRSLEKIDAEFVL
ncbi:MAG: hypothetical protein HY735_12395 [Verrucomicrobia bacterium]|nr:hypothetical protein [Verrucomicrobiota bacterium]